MYIILYVMSCSAPIFTPGCVCFFILFYQKQHLLENENEQRFQTNLHLRFGVVMSHCNFLRGKIYSERYTLATINTAEYLIQPKHCKIFPSP